MKDRYEGETLPRLVLAGNLEGVKRKAESPEADVTARDEEGNSLLHLAVKSGNPELVRYLTERVGMDPLAGNSCGVTAWDLARESGRREIEAYFAKRAGFSYEDSFHNPIRRGFFPDPSMVRVGDDYYMVNSSFVYFPCIPVSHSRDLLHWRIIGYAVASPEYAYLDRLNGGMGYWAPDISYCDGRFYITATLRLNQDMERRRVQMITSSDRPEGPYEEPVFLDVDGIDPSLYHENGRHYMLLNKGARILELSADCRFAVSEPELLWYGDCKIKPEGPHLIRRGEYYYIFLAEGGTGMGHRIAVARSGNLTGPYEPCPYNPILRQRDEKALIQCTGHGKPVEMQDGRWCIPYLCLRKPGGGPGYTGRETALDLLEWTADGWPVVNRGRGPSQQARKPFASGAAGGEPDGRVPAGDGGVRAVSPYPAWQGQDWMTPRPLSADRVWESGGRLFLTGQKEDLCSPLCRSIFVKRQEEFVMSAGCGLVIPDLREGQSLGLVCYYDENSYIKFGVTVENGEMCMLLQEYAGEDYRSSRTMRISDGAELRGGIRVPAGKAYAGGSREMTGKAYAGGCCETAGNACANGSREAGKAYADGSCEMPEEACVDGSREMTGKAAAGGSCEVPGNACVCAPCAEISLFADISYGRRGFRWKFGNAEGGPLVLEDTSYLASEGLAKGKRFTGAAIGVYVHGEIRGEFTRWY